MNPYSLALTLIPGLGPKSIRQLADIYPDTESLFALSRLHLTEIFGKHEGVIDAIARKSTLSQAEAYIAESEKYHINMLSFTDPAFPQRLNAAGCEDSPVVLYVLGTCDLNAQHSIAMVGSRKATDYGRTTTSRLVEEMAADKPLIVSGLAYGIDTTAHTAAVSNGLPTVAVLGHGLDIIYPNQNRSLAKRIVEQGGALVTEYPLHTEIKATNFPARNRIIAGLSDATIVVEAAERGGALITANIASSYNREVFAVPGRLDDTTSEGCNNLIVNNKAIMIRNAGDLFFQMGWKNTFDKKRRKEQQQKLFATLSANEQMIVDLLTQNKEMTMDEIDQQCDMPLPKIASVMVELELKNVIRCLPGRIYKLS